MAYDKHAWVKGDKVNPTRMNHIEGGIGDAHDELNVVASAEHLGRVKVDNDTITIDEDGTLHGASQVPEGVLVGVEGEETTEHPKESAWKAIVDGNGKDIAQHFFEVEEKIGDTDKISSIGDGTASGAIQALSNTLTALANKFFPSTEINYIGYSENTTKTTTLQNDIRIGSKILIYVAGYTSTTNIEYEEYIADFYSVTDCSLKSLGSSASIPKITSLKSNGKTLTFTFEAKHYGSITLLRLI